MIAFLIVALIVMVICAVGALVAGVRYWMDGWQLSRRLLEDDKCTDNNNVCSCTGQAEMPVSGKVIVTLVLSSLIHFM